jgi:tripartite-type tricarboxylate transporter receptor subunit TctC
MRTLFALLVSILAAGQVSAQGYPSKPISLVIPFGAGGDSDLSGRLLAQHAAKYLGNATFVPLNRVGASGSIGTMQVRNAPPDGYTLLVARIATHSIFPALESKSPYKWNEFTILSLLELNPYICAVRADSPIKTVQDLYAAIRKDPGKLNFSTAGPGTSQNMASQYMMSLAGLKPDAAVGIHYKSGGEVTTAVLGGQVQFACNNATTMVSQIRAGTLRGLFVTTAARLPEAPDLQTAREAGVPDMEKIVGWTAVMGPPGMPKEVVDKWASALASVARDPEWLAGIAKIGGIPAIRSPGETEKYLREQFELYDALITTLGIRQ